MALVDAARAAYSQTRQSTAAKMAEAQGKTPDLVIQWYALLLVEKFGIPLRGRRPPSDTDEQIEFAGDRQITREEGKLVLKDKYGEGYFEDLTVPRSALPIAVEAIAKWPREDDKKKARSDTLAEFLLSADDLFNRPIKSKAALGRWKSDFQEWLTTTRHFIRTNVSASQELYFAEPGPLVIANVPHAFNDEHNSLLNRLGAHRRNLRHLHALES